MWLLMLAPVMGSLLKDGGGAARVVITAPRNRFVALAKETRGGEGREKEKGRRRGNLFYLLDGKRRENGRTKE